MNNEKLGVFNRNFGATTKLHECIIKILKAGLINIFMSTMGQITHIVLDDMLNCFL